MKPALIVEVALAVIINFAPWSKAQQHPNAIEQHAQADGQSDGKRLASPNNSESPVAEAETAKNKPPNWYKSPEWVLAIVGAITCVFLGWQAWETRRAAEATQASAETIQRQVNLMERQTKATETAANAAEKSSEILINSERAWIDGELVRETFPAVRYRLKIVNHGKTPARMLSFEINCGCLSEGTEFSPRSLGMRQAGKLHFLLGTDKSRLLDEVEPLNMHVVFGGCLDAGAYCVTVRYADVVAGGEKSQDRETSFVYYCRFLLDSLERLSEYDEYK
jgi:hypothetical protein